MTEQDAEQQTEHSGQEPGSGQKTDPVRRWTLILLAVALLLLVIHLRADRFTPYTSQARLHALVVPVASEVSGSVVAVSVSSNQEVVAGQELFRVCLDHVPGLPDGAALLVTEVLVLGEGLAVDDRQDNRLAAGGKREAQQKIQRRPGAA